MKVMANKFARRTRCARRGNRQGGAVLETAIVMPMILILTFGMIEVGHYFYLKHAMQCAAREAARLAILPKGDPSAAVSSAMARAGLVNGYTVTTDPVDLSTAVAGDEMTVTIEATWSDVGVRPMTILSGSLVLRGSAVMMKEGNYENSGGVP